jgi:formate hydrogenlyase subunit 3/multisubunit Na+/H+ antiporter MnhD subunit
MATIAAAPWIVWTIALPLAAAIVVFIARTRAVSIGLLASLGVAGAVSGLSWQVVQRGSQRYAVGGWSAPLGIELVADGLTVCMLLFTATVAVPIGIYASAYFSEDGQTPTATPDGGAAAEFWMLWLFLWAALNALFVSGDVFNLYVTLELLTLAAVALVSLARAPTATAAALNYLLAALFGSLLYLLGVALLYADYGTLDVAALGQRVSPGASTSAALSLIAVGLALKAALFPLHFWLPPAHASAPAPVSAVLSGLVVKASFYVFLRLWFDVFPAVVTTAAGTALGMLGAGAIVWGSLQAIAATGLKALVAYSTVAQLGYLFLVFALTAPGLTSVGWSGAILFVLSHGCAKASMFMAAGSILRVAGHDRIVELAGVGRRLPVTFFTIALASVTLMGLPPSGAFVAKWMLLEAAFTTGQIWLALVIVGGGLLAASYLFRILGQAFTSSADEASLRLPLRMEMPALLLALVAVLLGLVAAPILDVLDIRAP